MATKKLNLKTRDAFAELSLHEKNAYLQEVADQIADAHPAGLLSGSSEKGDAVEAALQDVHQLRSTYGQKAGTFLSNAGVLQVFGVNDHDSARLI